MATILRFLLPIGAGALLANGLAASSQDRTVGSQVDSATQSTERRSTITEMNTKVDAVADKFGQLLGDDKQPSDSGDTQAQQKDVQNTSPTSRTLETPPTSPKSESNTSSNLSPAISKSFDKSVSDGVKAPANEKADTPSDKRPIIMRNADLPLYVAREILLFVERNPEQLDRIAAQFELQLVSEITAPSIGVTMLRAKILGTRSVEETVRQIEQEAAIVWAQPNFIYQLLGNSRSAGLSMHGLNANSAILPGGLPALHPSRTIVIIDSPVDKDHSSLVGARIEQRGALSKAAGSPHGTAIAELLVGSGPYKGIVPGARLVSIPAFMPVDNDDWHAPSTSTSERLIEALELAGDIRPNVLNLSWGTLAGFDEAIKREINQLFDEGVCIAAAAGNSVDDPVLFPAKIPSTIAVAAVDIGEESYQNGSRGQEIDIAAWGVGINAAVPGGRRQVTGTSFASPIVAGAMLLMPACGDARRPQALRLALSRDAKDLGVSGRDEVFGAGLLRFGDAALGSADLNEEEIIRETPVFPREEIAFAADEGGFGLLYAGGGLASALFLLFFIWRKRQREQTRS